MVLELTQKCIFSMFGFFGDIYDGTVKTIDDYYLWWVLAPLFFTVVLPILIVLLIYVDVVIVFIYTLHWGQIVSAYDNSFSNGALHLIAAIWDVHSRIWHGYEIVGMDNIPAEGGALLISYHGSLPVDHYYIMTKLYLNKTRRIFTIGDKFLFKLPGFPALATAVNIIPGSVQECVQILKRGELLAIYPGGVYESQFGDSNYKLMWKNRLGFAKAALEAKVDIIPVFTQNIREAFVNLPIGGRNLWMKLYSWTRLPLVPILGDFPVKLRTFIGKPIPYEPLTPEQLKLKVAQAIDAMILEHQRLPGSIFQALLDRFRPYHSKVT